MPTREEEAQHQVKLRQGFGRKLDRILVELADLRADLREIKVKPENSGEPKANVRLPDPKKMQPPVS